MARETGHGGKESSASLQSKQRMSLSCSENSGIESSNSNCPLDKKERLGNLCCSCQCQSNSVRLQLKQSSLQKSAVSSISNGDSSAFFQEDSQQLGSRKSTFGNHSHRERTLTCHRHFNYPKLFTRLSLWLCLLLSVCSTPSSAYDLPWDRWSIEDPSAPGYLGDHSSAAVNVPDLVAIAGHLFQYQIQSGGINTLPLHFQAREAGRSKLPNWLSLNCSSGIFTGVPLSGDKGKLYITLNVYVSKGGGSVMVSETLFSLKVVGLKAFASLMPPEPQTTFLSRTNCREKFYYLSQEDIPSYPTCSSGSLPVLATLLTYPSMQTLSGSARADLLVSLSKALNICLHSLVVDATGWSSMEQMKIWRQLAEAGITEYLDSTSSIYFSLSCSLGEYKSQAIDMVLRQLDLYISEHLQTTGVDIVLRFVSWGTDVLEKSVVPEGMHTRLHRQVVDLEELPTIEVTTASPELVSSSSTAPSPSSSQQHSGTSTVDGGVSVLPTINTTSTTMADMFTSDSIDKMPEVTSRSFGTTISAGDNVPRATSLGVSLPRPGFDTATVPGPTSKVLSMTDMPASPSRADMPISTAFSGADAPTTTLSVGFSMTDTTSSTSTGSTDQLISTSPTLPSTSVIPNPTATAGVDLQTSPGAAQSGSMITPSNRVVPSSEPTLVLTPSSLPPTIQPSLPQLASSSSQRHTSSEAGPELAVSSIPVMSLMFTMQSLLTSLPLLTESVSPTTSVQASRLFTIQSSIDDLRSPTPSLSTFSLPLSSFSLPASSSDIVLMPETSSPLPSPSPSLSPSFSTQLLTESSPAPVITSDIRLPDTTVLLQTSSVPSISPEPTSSVLIIQPTTLPEFTSDLLMPETSLVVPATSDFPVSSSSGILIEPTPSFSSEVLTTPIPESTVLSSSAVLSSSNNLLVPMSSSELTLSVSIYTPSPSPSFSLTSVNIFPEPSSTPTSAPMTIFPTSLQVDMSSMIDIFPETSSVVFVTPTTSSAASSDLFTSSTPIPSSSEEVVFPKPTTIFIPPSPSLAVSPSFPIIPTSTVALQTELISSADITSSFADVFTSPLPSIPSPTDTIVIIPESTMLEPPLLTTFETFTIPPSVTVDLTETFVLEQTTQVLFTTLFPTATPTLPTTLPSVATPSTRPSLPPTLSPSPSPSLPPSPPPSLSPSPSPSLPSSPSPTSPPSLSPSPSPTPPLTLCEQYNIVCKNGICLSDDRINITSLEICECFPDYTGILCDITIDDCSPSQCSVDGTRLCVDGNATFTCVCREEYTGELCDQLLFPCLATPCHSLATCVDLGMGQFECVCPVGYSGMFCEEDIDPCDPDPCQPSETCVVIDSQNFTCSERSVSVSAVASTPPPSGSITTASSFFVTPSPSIATSSSLKASPTASSTSIQSSVAVTPSPTLTPSPPVSNESPVLINPIGTLIANRGQIFRFSVPENTFYDQESGSTSSLSLTLLNYRGDPLSNTTWVQVNQGNIEGLPLSSEVISEAITDHLFILQARDDVGNSAHDFVTIRVLPLGPFSSLLTVLFENEFEILNQNITQKINLVERLSSSAISTRVKKRQLGPQSYSPEEIFIRDILNTSPLAVSYKNLTIPDLNCSEFYRWIENIYNFTSNEYTLRFLEAMAPDFLPTPTPSIEGICQLTTSNIPPTLSDKVEIDVSDSDISHRSILLATLVPAACLALCCLLCGLCALCMYRRKRSERKYCTSRRLYLNRQPIILEGEADFPNRRGRPIILENDLALERDSDEEDEDGHLSVSSEFSFAPPPEGERERLVRHPSVSPPNYRLPPLYTHSQFYDFTHTIDHDAL